VLVLFDIGSTLLEGPAIGPGTRLAKALGLPQSDNSILSDLIFQRLHTSPDTLARTLAHELSLPRQEVLDAVNSLWVAQIAEAHALPGAHRALSDILGAGHRVAFVSNIWLPFLEAFSHHFPDTHDSCRGYYSFRMGISKPDRSIFRAALDDFGVNPRDAVVIGDTYNNDIRPAMEVGMHAIWVLHRPEKEKTNIVQVLNGNAPKPSLTIETIGDLNAGTLTRFRD
jgi:FMN phosphatase YigB (HAD superfamily)